ncbi:MAG TPA: hypothetical protein VJZ91_10520 [Blastocatellia bacterium]|nr:hypothetical protein [Blastocatellia bacterium]
MKTAVRLCVAALVVGLSACAGVVRKPIAVDPGFWQDRNAVIGVAAAKMPEADAHMMGQQGLLDVAINRGNAGKMIEQLKRLDLKRAAAIHDNMAAALGRRGFKVEKLQAVDVATLPEFKIDASPELYAPRDFRSLSGKGVERLLLVSVEKIGTVRSYYGFLPTGAPRAMFAVQGQLIDLKTNKLIWYDRHETTAAIPEPWDQEPDFPNVSATVLKNMEEGAAVLERSLFMTPGQAPAAK